MPNEAQQVTTEVTTEAQAHREGAALAAALADKHSRAAHEAEDGAPVVSVLVHALLGVNYELSAIRHTLQALEARDRAQNGYEGEPDDPGF